MSKGDINRYDIWIDYGELEVEQHPSGPYVFYTEYEQKKYKYEHIIEGYEKEITRQAQLIRELKAKIEDLEEELVEERSCGCNCGV